MDLNEDQIRAVELMAKNEACIADLYRVYASKFPEVADFWNNLVSEEEEHEKILLALVKGVRSGDCFVRQKIFSSNVWKSISDIKLKIIEARQNDMTLREALCIASGLESGFLEQSYFRVVVSDSAGFQSTFFRLSKDTQRHQDSLKEMLAKY